MESVIRHTVLFIMVLMCTVLPSQAQASRTILMFGDSLTAGYRLDAHQALPAVVQRKLNEKKVIVNVVNGGVSGDTTTGGAGRLKWMLDKHRPDVVFLALGANDMLRGVPPITVKTNLEKMLDELKARNIKTILMSVKVPPNQDEIYTIEFNDVYPDLSRKYGVAIYPFILEPIFGQKDYMLNDGIHPNAKGIEYIAGFLADYLLQTGWL